MAVLALLGAFATVSGLPLGPALLEVTAPQNGTVLGVEGLQVMVRFPYGDRTHEETFRVLLNGADVTDAFTTGDNGAFGELYAFLDGDNFLQVGVFGDSWWLGGRRVEHTRAVHFRVRHPIDLNWG